MLRLGRGLFLALAAVLVVMVLVTYGRLPSVVASHFDGAGVPNGWSSRAGYSVLLTIVGALLPSAVVALVTAVTGSGAERLNIPARDYWRRPEHAGEAVRRVRAYIWWLGCIMAATALAIHVLVLAANAVQPPRLAMSGIVALLVGVLGAVGVWIAGWYRLLRPPGTP